VNEQTKLVLAGQLDSIEQAIRDVTTEAALDDMPAAYREAMLKAASEAAVELAAAAAGDEQAVANLRIIKARVALWAWAGAEHARQVFVLALRRWLRSAAEALGDLAALAIETGIRAMIDSGLNALEDSI
jgi:hypothetical protein